MPVKIKILGLAFLVIIIGAVAGLVEPARATEPTPTPFPEQPDTIRCRLETGAQCEFTRPGNLTAAGTFITQTNPPLAAQQVPTYTLVSVTFAGPMAAGTITNDTFYVQQASSVMTASSRINGSVEYIEAGRIAVFYPDAPLSPGTEFTATVTTGARDTAGSALPQNFEWTFTTFDQPVRVDGDLSAAGAPVGGGMTVYFGDLHAHSGYDDTGPNHDYLPGIPSDAFAVARANGLEFFALTGHDRYLNPARWQDIVDQADAATVNGTFIGLRGFEYTGSGGHLNVLETDTYVTATDSRYRNLIDFYAWLVAQPEAIGEFNHPSAGFNFNNFAYDGVVDLKIVLREIIYADQTLLSLNKGWHVGTLLNSDTHTGGWGSQKFMGVVASNLSRTAILEAIRARRTFYISPHGQRMAVTMRANGAWMGSAVPNTGTLNFTVTVSDPDHRGRSLNLRLYDNGVRVASVRLQGASLINWYPRVSARLGHYYYVEAYHDGWTYPAYSSPVWVERPPVANAGPTMYVPPNGSVAVDGRGSSDPDGDALAYRWQPSIGSVSPDDAGRVFFDAPSAPGQGSIALTVTDPGGLTDVDSTTVVVTDKPILAIVAAGPEQTAPGELITYTLTVTNLGITAASQVVVSNKLPDGAIYVAGGTLSGDTVSWTLSDLPANNGMDQVQYAVTAVGGLVNDDYAATCGDCIPAVGSVAVWTNATKLYFPLIMKRY